MIDALIAGIAVHGTGLNGWADSQPVLRGEAPWCDTPLALPPPAILAANERRRTSPLVRLILLSAADAVAMSGISPGRLRGVFGSSSGDGHTVCGILEALAKGEPLSPTAFHNSVHNAPAGYWSIAQSSMQPITCVGGYDDTFAASLLKAMAELQAEAEPVLLCVADLPLPAPLDERRPVFGGLAVSLVLMPWHDNGPENGPKYGSGNGHGIARLRLLDRMGSTPAIVAPTTAQPPIVQGNPAGRAWPLLTALATGATGAIDLPYLDGHLHLELSAC